MGPEMTIFKDLRYDEGKNKIYSNRRINEDDDLVSP